METARGLVLRAMIRLVFVCLQTNKGYGVFGKFLPKSRDAFLCTFWFVRAHLPPNAPRRWARVIFPITMVYVLPGSDKGNTEIARFGTPLD